MGGLDLPDLRTEMGIAQLKLLRNAVFAKTEVGKLILLSLKCSHFPTFDGASRNTHVIHFANVASVATTIHVST